MKRVAGPSSKATVKRVAIPSKATVKRVASPSSKATVQRVASHLPSLL